MRAARRGERPWGHPVTTTILPSEKLANQGTLLVPADVAGPRCGRSAASWWRDLAANRIPSPVKIGGRPLWRVQELREWVEAACPDRRTWEAMRAGKGGDL